MSDIAKVAKAGSEGAKLTDLATAIKPGSPNEPRQYPPGKELAVADGEKDI